MTLYADHYYPPGNGSSPTLLMRQPYGRDIASTVVYAHPAYFARHGYNVVIQDVRGRGDSEGEFYPFRHEGRDGAETIAALRRRPEADGRVGMYGFSYQGMTQLLAAAEAPEGLCCIAPAQTAHDLYRGWFYANGVLRLASALGWGLQMLKADARRLGLRDASERLERAWASLAAQLLETPYGGHPAIQAEGLPAYVRDWLEHDRPDEYWSAQDVSRCVHRIGVPALHISGWFDTYLSGSIAGFLALSGGASTAHAREHQYLVAGPWMHIPWGGRIGAYAFGPEANLDTDALHLRWFNHWLKDSGEFEGEPRIRHYALDFACGKGRWHEATEWPKPEEATWVFYLHSEGRANSSRGDGRLLHEAPAGDQPPDVVIFDPEVPVPAPGGLANAAGPSDQSTLELGNNVLVYTSAPLPRSTHLFGSAVVELYCATSATHADLVVKLILLRPSGEAIFVAIGIARSSATFSEYLADTPQRWQFEIAPTSCVFAPGDCIRIEIASSAWPLFDRNPGNAMPPRLADSWSWQRSTQLLFHDAARPSSIRLPITGEQRR
ncbi:MAG: CocE/NonD family hydrolase [Acidobacteriota bacterium]|nr:CocE/NonD family hydrolase [Acidobacteriota bacterium]